MMPRHLRLRGAGQVMLMGLTSVGNDPGRQRMGAGAADHHVATVVQHICAGHVDAVLGHSYSDATCPERPDAPP